MFIELNSFSHKRPFINGPTKATAYLLVSNGEFTKKISLSVHGIQGKSALEDGLKDTERYDSIIWKEYKIQLKAFYYDKSIEIVVIKNK